MGAEKDGDGAELQLEDAVSVDPKAVERKNRRALRKEKSRIMLVRSSSTLLYQIMREGAITLQHTQQQQQQQQLSASSSTSPSSQSQQADESKEVAKSPSHSPVSPRANSGSKVVSGKSKSENTSPGKGTKVAIKKKDKKRRKAGIAASAGMVETRTHYQDNESPPRLRLSSFSAETLPTLQVASSPEPETPMPSVASTPTAAAAVRPVLPPALYNLKSLCLKNCPKITDRTLDMLWQRCPHLQRLNVTHCPLLSNQKLMWLQEVYVHIDIVCNDRSQLKGVRGSGGPWNFQGFSY